MLNENNCNAATITVDVTPAQQHLLELCSHLEAEDLSQRIASLFELGTFHLAPDVTPDLDASLHTYNLMRALENIAQEVQTDHIYLSA